MNEGKQGLWANIHAKRKRIKNGSGERMRKPGEKGAPTAADFRAAQNEEVEEIETDDYKLSRSGKKIRAHKIVFNKGEDDGKKGVTEQMKKTYRDFVEQHTPDLTEEQKNELVAELQEVLGKDDPAGKWISDFVHSDNPKFKGKSKEKRKQMALAAYYAKQRNEEVEQIEEAVDHSALGRHHEDMADKELRKVGSKLPDAYDAVKFRKKLASHPKYATALKHLDKSEHHYSQAAKQKRVKEEVELDEAGPGGPLGYLSPEERAKEIARRKKAIKANETPASKRFVDNAMKNIKPKNEETEVQEELKGKQHKLDKNKNGKLDAHDFKLLRKEEQELDEAVTVKKHNYSWGKMVTVHHGSENSYPLHPEHQEAIRKLKDGEHTSFKDETNRKVTAHREGDKVHLSGAGSNKKTTVSHSHFSESVFDWKNKPRQTSDKSTTMTKHDVKKTSTGTVYTKQRDADGMSKEFKRDNEPAQKRGRGRPKKSSFGEAVEFLMSLSEEQFEDMMSEGFDTFFESYDQLDELSKTTLASYTKKAVSGMTGVAVNAHMAGGEKPGSEGASKFIKKAQKRIDGVDKAVNRLAK